MFLYGLWSRDIVLPRSVLWAGLLEWSFWTPPLWGRFGIFLILLFSTSLKFKFGYPIELKKDTSKAVSSWVQAWWAWAGTTSYIGCRVGWVWREMGAQLLSARPLQSLGWEEFPDAVKVGRKTRGHMSKMLEKESADHKDPGCRGWSEGEIGRRLQMSSLMMQDGMSSAAVGGGGAGIVLWDEDELPT